MINLEPSAGASVYGAYATALMNAHQPQDAQPTASTVQGGSNTASTDDSVYGAYATALMTEQPSQQSS